MADINSYALNLDFNLQTSAPQTLISISDQLGTIEDQITSVAAIMSKQATSAANDLAASVKKVYAEVSALNSEVTSIPINISNSAASVAEIDQGWQNVNDDMSEVTENAVEIKDEFEEINKIQEQLNKNMIEILDHTEDINKETKDTEKSFGKFSTGVVATALGFFGLGKAIKEAWKQEEQFERVGSRLYGTHQEITNEIREATFQNKMFTDAGIESYLAVAGAVKFSAEETANLVEQNKHLNKGLDGAALKNKVMREEMTKYAVAATQFNTITGISISTISNFMGQLKFYGLTLADTRMHMSKLTGAFKRAGTSAENMQKILDDMNETRPEIFYAWGEAGVEAQQTLTASAAIMAQQLGMSEAALAKELTGLMNNVTQRRKIGVAMKKMMDDQVNATKGITKAEALHMATTQTYRNELERLGQQWANATDTNEKFYKAMAFKEKFGIDVAKYTDKVRELDKEINAGLDGHRQTQKELWEAGRIAREYEEAIGSAGKKWDLTRQKFEKVVQVLITKLTPAIEFGIDVIDVMVTGLGELLGAFTETQKKTEGVTEVVEDATSAWDKLVDNFDSANLSLKNIAISVGSVVAAVWLAAKAWRFISKTIKPGDVVKLSAIAASAFAIGAGFLMMAGAFAIIAALGDKVIVPLAVLAAVLAGVMLAVVALSAAGPIGIGVMLALSVLMLSLGAASMMLAVALGIASFAFEKFIEVAQPIVNDTTFAVNFMILAGSILAGSIALLVAAPYLVVAAAMLSYGMAVLSAALWWIDVDNLIAIAGAFDMLANSLSMLARPAMVVSGMAATTAMIVASAAAITGASDSFVQAVEDMFDDLANINIDKKATNSVALAYYDLAHAIDLGLDAIEARSSRSKSVFGGIIADFIGMSLAIDRINTDMKTKLGADEIVKQRFEANTAKVATAKSDRDNEVRSQPIHETVVRDTFADKLRKQRQEELRAKAMLDKMAEQSKLMETTANNTGLLKDLKFSIEKQKKGSGASRGAIGSSHVTTWI